MSQSSAFDHPSAELQQAFLAVLPRIHLHAQIVFRHVRCRSTRDDAIAETVALAWKWFVRLTEQGKQPTEFVSAMADYAARAVRCGRRVCGQGKARDAFSMTTRRDNIHVVSLPDGSTLHGNPFDEALQDNTQTPVPEQASFRLDFPAWLFTRTDRDRVIIRDLMAGERTMDVSQRHSVSPARISQLRRQYQRSWMTFCRGKTPGG